MPYVNVKVTKEGGPEGDGPSPEQKAEIIKGVSDLLYDVLGKDPATTFVVINEVAMEDWGFGGMPVAEYRKRLASE
jgi:4-oxalocrotonate tautomerase